MVSNLTLYTLKSLCIIELNDPLLLICTLILNWLTILSRILTVPLMDAAFTSVLIPHLLTINLLNVTRIFFFSLILTMSQLLLSVLQSSNSNFVHIYKIKFSLSLQIFYLCCCQLNKGSCELTDHKCLFLLHFRKYPNLEMWFVYIIGLI